MTIRFTTKIKHVCTNYEKNAAQSDTVDKTSHPVTLFYTEYDIVQNKYL